jgi:hypothetical protein
MPFLQWYSRREIEGVTKWRRFECQNGTAYEIPFPVVTMGLPIAIEQKSEMCRGEEQYCYKNCVGLHIKEQY